MVVLLLAPARMRDMGRARVDWMRQSAKLIPHPAMEVPGEVFRVHFPRALRELIGTGHGEPYEGIGAGCEGIRRWPGWMSGFGRWGERVFCEKRS